MPRFPFLAAVLWLIGGVAAAADRPPATATAPADARSAGAVRPTDSDGAFSTVLRRQGDDGVHSYRIPGLATTANGSLIAVFDVRHDSLGDLPGNIDVGMMRSTDHGRSWSPLQIILDFDADQPDTMGNGVGDPAVLVDHQRNEIWVAALWSHGNRGWHGSGSGLLPQETGQLVLTRSSDDGLTWSPPINITQRIAGRDPAWRLCFNGPGNGIQLHDGTLVFAAQYRDAAGKAHSCFLSSSDGGEQWAISPPAVADGPPTSEAQICQLDDGSLLLSMRDESRSGQRLWARYHWQDQLAEGTWSEPWSDLPDPTCMASLVRHPDGRLLFCNPNSATARVALTIRSSTDNGQTWSDGRLVDSRPSAYSCLTVLADGSIGVLYECGDRGSSETLRFARFPPGWLDASATSPATDDSADRVAPAAPPAAGNIDAAATGQVDQSAAHRLRVLVYNIHHGRGMDDQIDLQRIAAVIRSADPDLVALQEVDQRTGRSGGVDQADQLAKLTNLTSQFAHQIDFQGGRYGQAILSRLSGSPLTLHWLPGTPERQRRLAARSQFTFASQRIALITTHLHHASEPFRIAQAEQLNRLFAASDTDGDTDAVDLTLLAGDLNATPLSGPLQVLQRRWQSATAGRDDLLTFPADRPDRQLDYLLYRSDRAITVRSAQVLDEPLASDHRPLLVDLEWRAP